jgi:hypothetical protein
MLRNVMAFVVASIALTACALPSGSFVSPSQAVPPAGVRRLVGALNIEPFEIVFSRRKFVSPPLVRVWQRGFRGRYVSMNQCTGVTVTLEKYAQRNASVWTIRLSHPRPQSCAVKFTGTGGPRGTNYLQLKILR